MVVPRIQQGEKGIQELEASAIVMQMVSTLHRTMYPYVHREYHTISYHMHIIPHHMHMYMHNTLTFMYTPSW